MHLLNTHTLKLEYFTNVAPGSYAILSHRWVEGEEVSFHELPDLFEPQTLAKSGAQKILKCCELARKDGYKYCWVDTCGIDKRASAELSEAINSMYRWYGEAGICYVYLADVHVSSTDTDNFEPEFSNSAWWTRAWTLQELLAPSYVSFYNHDWQRIGSSRSDSLMQLVSGITKVPRDALTKGSKKAELWHWSIAERMSWASKRRATREEDIAYSLLGIFQCNLPLLYGEGARAFERLQEEIIRTTDDQSIFAWEAEKDSQLVQSGLLATSPAQFATCQGLKPASVRAEYVALHEKLQQKQGVDRHSSDSDEMHGYFRNIVQMIVGPSQGYALTNQGLTNQVLAAKLEEAQILVFLEVISDQDYMHDSFVGIYLQQIEGHDNSFRRVWRHGNHLWRHDWQSLCRKHPDITRIYVQHKGFKHQYSLRRQYGFSLSHIAEEQSYRRYSIRSSDSEKPEAYAVNASGGAKIFEWLHEADVVCAPRALSTQYRTIEHLCFGHFESDQRPDDDDDMSNQRITELVRAEIGTSGPICNLEVRGRFRNMELIQLALDSELRPVCIIFNVDCKAKSYGQPLLDRARSCTLDYDTIQLTAVTPHKAHENDNSGRSQMSDSRGRHEIEDNFSSVDVHLHSPYLGYWAFRVPQQSMKLIKWHCYRPRRHHPNYVFEQSYGWTLSLQALDISPKVLWNFSIDQLHKKENGLSRSRGRARARRRSYVVPRYDSPISRTSSKSSDTISSYDSPRRPYSPPSSALPDFLSRRPDHAVERKGLDLCTCPSRSLYRRSVNGYISYHRRRNRSVGVGSPHRRGVKASFPGSRTMSEDSACTRVIPDLSAERQIEEDFSHKSHPGTRGRDRSPTPRSRLRDTPRVHSLDNHLPGRTSFLDGSPAWPMQQGTDTGYRKPMIRSDPLRKRTTLSSDRGCIASAETVSWLPRIRTYPRDPFDIYAPYYQIRPEDDYCFQRTSNYMPYYGNGSVEYGDGPIYAADRYQPAMKPVPSVIPQSADGLVEYGGGGYYGRPDPYQPAIVPVPSTIPYFPPPPRTEFSIDDVVEDQQPQPSQTSDPTLGGHLISDLTSSSAVWPHLSPPHVQEASQEPQQNSFMAANFGSTDSIV